MQTARIAVLLAAAWLATAQPGLAQDARQRQAAAEAYDQGTAAYLAGEYEKAAEWFETANRLAPAAPALIQAARASQEAGEKARAATVALRLTTQYPDEPAVMQFAEEMLGRLAGELVRVDVSCGDCTLDVDGTLQEWPSFFVTAGETHVVTASFETGDRTAEIAGEAGSSESIEFEAPPPEPVTGGAAEEPEPARGVGARPLVDREAKPLDPVFTFVGAGLTAALAAGSVLSTIDMNSGVDPYEQAVTAYNAACNPPARNGTADCNALYESAKEKLEEGQSKETRTTVLWAATGVAGAATLAIALLLTDWDGEDAPTAKRPGLRVAVVPGMRGASVVMKGRF